MRRPGDPSLLDLDREDHMGSVREALLFCCLDDRPVEKRLADAIAALRTCARWFPLDKERVATHCSGCGTTLDGSYCPQCEPPEPRA